MEKNFTKEFFQQAWGEHGYYEDFSYGVGIEKVCEKCLYPFLNNWQDAIEVGSGGGTFTKRMLPRVRSLMAIDVIAKPVHFAITERFTYLELPNQNVDCPGINDQSFDFAFSYNVFCHLSNDMLTGYLRSVNRILKKGSSFVFMLSRYEGAKQYFKEGESYEFGEMTSTGHFHQEDKTIDVIVDLDQWHVVNRDMIPEHRDLIVHLLKF